MIRVVTGCLLCVLAWVDPLSAAGNKPDLLGTWVLVAGENRTAAGVLDEQKRGTIEIEVVEQTEATFAGKYRWSRPGTEGQLNDGTTETTAGEEDFIGVFSWDGTSFIMVDHPDTSIRTGRFVNPQTIETILVESGPYAFVARQVYVRQ
jgi:hypothetical protein